MKKLKIMSISVILSLLLLFIGCSKPNAKTDENTEIQEDTSVSATIDIDFAINTEEMFSNRDYEIGYDEGNAVLITLEGNSAKASSNSVIISDQTVTITEEATYIVSGTLNDGQIIVNTTETSKLQIVFNNVTINSSTSAPVYIIEADKVFLTLATNSDNRLSNGGSFVATDENNIDSVIFSKQDLTINGDGSLHITSPSGHGIVCKDDLVMIGGNHTITSASHGIDANDSIRISNASITIDAGKDGIHAENSDDETLGFVYISNGIFDIEAEGDGISASSHMQIDNGNFNILAGGGSVNAQKQTSDFYGGFMGGKPSSRPSASTTSSQTESDTSGTSIKGIKSAGSLIISDGTFKIDSADDSVHSNTSILVSNGTFEIASGDDAFHADETLGIVGGTINITESYEGLEALNVKVSGGNIKLVASDDGINAAGGTDSSGMGGFRGGDSFGGGGRPGGGGMQGMGGMSSSSNGSIEISGGTLYINSSGDGMDANGTLTISGGHVTVCGPTQGDTATLDYDKSGIITGGTFIGTGASGMAQTFSDSEQGVVSVSVGNQSAGAEIILKDSNGKVIITHSPELSFAVVIISTPDMVKGETYTVTIGDVSGNFEAA